MSSVELAKLWLVKYKKRFIVKNAVDAEEVRGYGVQHCKERK